MHLDTTTLITILIAFLGLIGALMAWLIKESKDAGRREGKLNELLEDVRELKGHLVQIPEMSRKVGQIESLYETLRSDIRELKRQGRGPSWHDGEE